MNIQFNSLSLRNFLSYGNNITTFNFTHPGTTLIVGENLDNTVDGTGSNGTGKAQPLHCKVKTPTGWTTIKECSVGTIISTPDGKSAEITGVFLQGPRHVYKLTFNDGRTTEADGEHLWNCFINNITSPSNFTTNELRELLLNNTNIQIPLIIPEKSSVDSIGYNSTIDLYKLGIILSSNFEFTEGYIKYELSKLKKLQLWDGVIANRHIPKEILIGASADQREMLLNGILDNIGANTSDGIELTITNKQLIDDVVYLARSLGKTAEVINPLKFNPTETRIIKINNDSNKLRLIDIEYVGVMETKCIMIDHPDHLYITDNFVVTHNTSIINALSYSLYDKPISDISKDNLINNINKKNMEVTIDFSIGVNNYVIKRERKSKNGNNVYLWINGEDKTLDSAANTNNKIQNILGISYELFVRIVVFSASHRSFLDLSKSEQSSMFEQLVGLTTLSDKAALLKDVIKETESHIQIQNTKISMLEKEHERFNTQIKLAKNKVEQWKISTESEILQIQSQLNKLSGVDVNAQQLLHEQLTNINNEMSTKLSGFKSIESKIDRSNTQLKKFNNELVHLQDNKCPYCLQQYTDTQTKISELLDNTSNLQLDINTLSAELIEIDKQIEFIESERDIIADQLTTSNIKELIKIKSQSDVLTSKIETLTNSTNPYTETYNELVNTILDEISYEQVNTLTTQLDHQKFLLKLLTKKDSFVRKALLNKYIPYLNTRLQFYLAELKLPHKVEFTYEMTANISQFNRPLDFGNLSAGQKARVNLALSLAFSDVLQNIHKKINICILDEVLDIGLDSNGARFASKLLKNKAKEDKTSLYIISHREEAENMFDNTLKIQLQKGFSYILD